MRVTTDHASQSRCHWQYVVGISPFSQCHKPCCGDRVYWYDHITVSRVCHKARDGVTTFPHYMTPQTHSSSLLMGISHTTSSQTLLPPHLDISHNLTKPKHMMLYVCIDVVTLNTSDINQNHQTSPPSPWSVHTAGLVQFLAESAGDAITPSPPWPVCLAVTGDHSVNN